jgi:NADPH:quinone reductase-like Zn-dependent oxidoreductase
VAHAIIARRRNEDHMKAYALPAADQPVSFVDVPVPQAPQGGLLIRVRAASVNGIDVFQSKGFLVGVMPHEFPAIVGRDFAGVVEALGEGHDEFAVGDEVLGFIPVWPTVHLGTYAEMIAVGPELPVVRKPAELTFETAAAIPLAGATAMDVFDAVDPESGETVLVIGATGGVGSIAVQLAAQRGATVIATAKSGDEDAFVRSLSASETIDYAVEDVTEIVRRRYPAGVDALIDLVDRNEALAALSAIVKDGGRISTTMNAVDSEALAARRIQGANVAGMPTAEKLAYLAEQVAGGILRIEIQQTFPFEDAPAALEAFMAGTRGKVVVRVSDPE